MPIWKSIRTKFRRRSERRRAKEHSHAIDEQIRRARDEKTRQVKCLLFGIAEAGKSTLLHHLDLLAQDESSDERWREDRRLIVIDALDSLSLVLRRMHDDTCLKLKLIVALQRKST